MQNQSYNRNVLDTGRIGSLLMKLSAPMFFGMFIQNIYNIVDTIFVGRYVRTEGLAAISIIMPLQMLVFGTSNMFSIGGASLISRLIGQREKEKAERALGNSLFFAVLFFRGFNFSDYRFHQLLAETHRDLREPDAVCQGLSDDYDCRDGF